MQVRNSARRGLYVLHREHCSALRLKVQGTYVLRTPDLDHSDLGFHACMSVETVY